MKTYRDTGTFFSILIHVFVVIMLSQFGRGVSQGSDSGKNGGGKKGNQSESQEIGGGFGNSRGKIIDKSSIKLVKPSKELLDQIKKDEDQMTLKEKKQKTEKEKIDNCKNYFGGIGISIEIIRDNRSNNWISKVTKVYSGYPAEKIGIREGDYILDEVRGEIGGEVTFRVVRNGALRIYTTVRDKICTETIEP